MRNFNIKGQAFIQDLIISIFIITIFLVIFFNVEKNNVKADSEIGISLEAKTLSDYLVSAGYPNDWNSTNVMKIGITDNNNVIDKTKLEKLHNLTLTNYDRSRYVLGVKNDFIFFFTDYSGNIVRVGNFDFYGKPGYDLADVENDKPSNLFKVSRFVVLKEGVNVTSKIIEMKIYVWKKE